MIACVSQEKRRKKVIFHRERRPGFIYFGLNEKLEGKSSIGTFQKTSFYTIIQYKGEHGAA